MIITLAKIADEEVNMLFIDDDIHFKDERDVIVNLFKLKDKSGIHIDAKGSSRLSAGIEDTPKVALDKSKLEAEYV